MTLFTYSDTPAHPCPAVDPLVGSYTAHGLVWDFYLARGEEGETDLIFHRWGADNNHETVFHTADEIAADIDKCSPAAAAIYRDVIRRVKA